MNPGDLRERITILDPNGTIENECGEEVPAFVPLVTIWAATEPLSGREYYEAQKIKPEMSYRFRIRYREGITSDMRVEFKGRVFELVSPPINVDEQNRELHLMCKETTNV